MTDKERVPVTHAEWVIGTALLIAVIVLMLLVMRALR